MVVSDIKEAILKIRALSKKNRNRYSLLRFGRAAPKLLILFLSAKRAPNSQFAPWRMGRGKFLLADAPQGNACTEQAASDFSWKTRFRLAVYQGGPNRSTHRQEFLKKTKVITCTPCIFLPYGYLLIPSLPPIAQPALRGSGTRNIHSRHIHRPA